MATNEALLNPSPPAVDRRIVIAGLAALASGIAGARRAFAAEPAGQVEMAKGRSTGLLNGGLRDLEVEIRRLPRGARADLSGGAPGAGAG